MNGQTFFQNPRKWGRSHHHSHLVECGWEILEFSVLLANRPFVDFPKEDWMFKNLEQYAAFEVWEVRPGGIFQRKSKDLSACAVRKFRPFVDECWQVLKWFRILESSDSEWLF